MSEKRLLNKKAQELSIGTLVLIVLGIIVLVLIILGFTMGWQNLLDKINIFNPASSLDSVFSACNTAGVAGQTDAYCNQFRKIKDGSNTRWVNCEYSEIATRVENKLSCGDMAQKFIDKCTLLFPDKTKADDKTFVNSATCQSILNPVGPVK